MARFALLIGISQYSSDLSPLPAAVKDVQALQSVLENPEMGNFDRVQTILDQDVQIIRRSIEDHFLQCGRDDLALLFFSGHGIKDDFGKLYLASKETAKDKYGNLIRSTSVETSFIQEAMTRSRSRHKVVILDCCFSGAFGEGFLAKDDGVVDIENQLGGEGIAVLTSSTSLQYSFEHEDLETSIYTRYLVEGIETGAADLDSDGLISSGELHDYTARKVSEAAPAMKPKFFGFEEGFRIYLSQAPTKDPTLQYRRAVEQAAKLSLGTGEISEISQQTLVALRDNLGIPLHTADRIAYEVLEPYRKKQRSLQNYEKALKTALSKEYPLTARSESELRHLQSILGLQNEDIEPIRSKLFSEKESLSLLPALGISNDSEVSNIPDNEALLALETALEANQVNVPQSLLSTSIQVASQEESNVGKHRLFGFSTQWIALGFFISTVTAGVLAYQFLWKESGREEVPIAFQSTSRVLSFINEGIDKLIERKQYFDEEGKRINDRAWELYVNDGEIEAAIEELEKVNRLSSEYNETQNRRNVWQAAFESNQRNLQLSQTALNSGNLTRAENYAKAIDIRDQPYWQYHQQEILSSISQERAKLALQSHQLICRTSGSGATLQQFQVDAEGSPVISVSGEPVTDRYLLVEGTRVMLTQSSASSQLHNLTDGLSFVEVKEEPYIGEKGWVDSSFLCPLSN